jgi:hypothetical protein
MRLYFKLFLVIILINFSCQNNGEIKKYYYWDISVQSKNKITVLNKEKQNKTYYVLLIDKDTFYLEKSPWSNSLYESNPPVFNKNNQKIAGETNVFYSEFPEQESRIALYMQHFFLLDTSNNIRKIIKQPKITANGMTGVSVIHIDGENNLSMYANNLSLKAQLNAIEMYKSIRLEINK